jgi:hypothetical protein
MPRLGLTRVLNLFHGLQRNGVSVLFLEAGISWRT